MLEGREDLTHLPLPTIDPEDARDHDDAVWVERTSDGGYTAWIAIADVSSYVRKGTILDAESMKRGCSIYLPDRAIPMLPRPLSSNLCSLLPDVIRLCLCVVADIDAGGHVKRAKVVRGFMTSRAKLTYGGVARALGMSDVPPKDPKAEELIDGLRVAQECSRLLRVQRMKRGSLDFDLPEAKIILDDKGHPKDVIKRTQDPGMKKAYALIEDLMLLANECVATWLTSLEIPTVYRVHAPPDEKKLMILAAMCEQLGVPFDIEDARDPKKLQALLKSFAGHPQANVLNMLLLRSMKQATYDTVNIGHFGLASKSYLHFTSPIRRYPDLVVHRTVHSELLGERGHKGTAAAEKLGEAALAASTAERKAMEIEREVVDLYRAVMMRDRIGERYEGTVTALVGSGMFVQLDSPFVDVLVRLEDLGGDRWELDEEKMRVTAPRSGESIGLGDRLMIEIIDVQILRRTVYGRRIGGGASGEREARGAGGTYERKGSSSRPSSRARRTTSAGSAAFEGRRRQVHAAAGAPERAAGAGGQAEDREARQQGRAEERRGRRQRRTAGLNRSLRRSGTGRAIDVATCFRARAHVSQINVATECPSRTRRPAQPPPAGGSDAPQPQPRRNALPTRRNTSRNRAGRRFRRDESPSNRAGTSFRRARTSCNRVCSRDRRAGHPRSVAYCGLLHRVRRYGLIVLKPAGCTPSWRPRPRRRAR